MYIYVYIHLNILYVNTISVYIYMYYPKVGVYLSAVNPHQDPQTGGGNPICGSSFDDTHAMQQKLHPN